MKPLISLSFSKLSNRCSIYLTFMFNLIIILKQCKKKVVGVAQVVRASGCGPEGRGFKSPHSPQYITNKYQLIPVCSACYPVQCPYYTPCACPQQTFSGIENTCIVFYSTYISYNTFIN